MSYRLPPLNTLRQFEAAGRYLSFRLAAEELNVTPSAVSHGVQTLEDWLGIALFIRDPRGLVLTEAGAAYLPRVREALEILTNATEVVPGRLNGRLSISVAPSFGARWLVPKLPRFRERHPDIEVSLDTSHRRIEFPRDGVDLAIRMGQGDCPDLYTDCLIMEDLVPVCAPGLGEAIRTAEDLTTQTLLHVTDISEDWAAWARLAGVDGFELGELDLERGLRFDTIDMAWAAAAQGLGIAIGRLPLIASDLSAGRLVTVLGEPRRSQTGYWLTAGHETVKRAEVIAFRDWLQGELNEAEWPG